MINTLPTTSLGQTLYQWAVDLFPICRSLTGNGNRDTLNYIKNILPGLRIHEIESGTKAFDWEIPNEWNIQDAYVKNSNGQRVIDFKKHNLHVVNYSIPVNRKMSFQELDLFLHSLPDQPDAVPYVCSYYQQHWGFCLSHHQREELRTKPDEIYEVVIDSTLRPGYMTFGELIIPGKTEEEILLTTYICHPSMANNELSGIVVTTALAQWLLKQEDNRYTYRILFMPETIGAIYYLSKHFKSLKEDVQAGFVITCVGDNNKFSYLSSRQGNTLADRTAKHILKHKAGEFIQYQFIKDRGSDERQYCSPGIDLPVCSISRSKYNEYPEYHTSEDDLNFISTAGLESSFEVFKACLRLLEVNQTYVYQLLCEPNLGKRNLYPKISTKKSFAMVEKILNLLMYADGNHDVISLAEMNDIYFHDLLPIIEVLKNNHLIKAVSKQRKAVKPLSEIAIQ